MQSSLLAAIGYFLFRVSTHNARNLGAQYEDRRVSVLKPQPLKYDDADEVVVTSTGYDKDQDVAVRVN